METKLSALEKLHPAALLLLSAIRGVKPCANTGQVKTGWALFIANMLHALLTVPAGEISNPPAHAQMTTEECVQAAEARIAALLAVAPDKEAAQILEAFTEVIQHPERMFQILDPFFDSSPRNLKPIGDLIRAPRDALRSNRDSRPAARKTIHRAIFLVLFTFGNLQGSDSEFSLGVLTAEETNELLDAFCPTCDERHSEEATRKEFSRLQKQSVLHQSQKPISDAVRPTVRKARQPRASGDAQA
jgi:hypothetical protein